jgi:hypothetical protein
MPKKYSESTKSVERMKLIQIVLIVLCVIIFIAYIFFITRPKLTQYTITDDCGPIGGQVSHTVGNTDTCSNKCTAHCLSLKKEYHDSSFEAREGPICNLCVCNCKN